MKRDESISWASCPKGRHECSSFLIRSVNLSQNGENARLGEAHQIRFNDQVVHINYALSRLS